MLTDKTVLLKNDTKILTKPSISFLEKQTSCCFEHFHYPINMKLVATLMLSTLKMYVLIINFHFLHTLRINTVKDMFQTYFQMAILTK